MLEKPFWSRVFTTPMFLFLKTVYFHFRFLCKSDLRISYWSEVIEKLSESTTFRVRKTTVSSTFFDQIKVSMVTFVAWKVTWNYAYSLFKRINIIIYYWPVDNYCCSKWGIQVFKNSLKWLLKNMFIGTPCIYWVKEYMFISPPCI